MDPRLSFIMSRRSVRKYAGSPVSEEDIQALLEAAASAPSAINLKPWRFVVVTEKETLEALSLAHPHGRMLADAALAIAVCGDLNVSPDYWVQDCTAATQNILLAVTALSLGAVWLGVHPREERKEAIRKLLGIPKQVEILSLISIGRPAEEKEPRTQLEDAMVHREKW